MPGGRVNCHVRVGELVSCDGGWVSVMWGRELVSCEGGRVSVMWGWEIVSCEGRKVSVMWEEDKGQKTGKGNQTTAWDSVEDSVEDSIEDSVEDSVEVCNMTHPCLASFLGQEWTVRLHRMNLMHVTSINAPQRRTWFKKKKKAKKVKKSRHSSVSLTHPLPEGE